MKTPLMAGAATLLIATTILASLASTNDLSNYVCTDRFFAVPESVDPSNLDEARLLVKANPDRFESHLILASALIKTGGLQEALDEFKVVDELATKVHDPAVLSGLEYDGVYAFTLFAVAEQRIKKDFNDLYTLRMLQQVIGMDYGILQQKRLLSRCYLYIAIINIKRGSYDAALHAVEIGKNTAQAEGNAENEKLLEEIRLKASALQTKKNPTVQTTTKHEKNRSTRCSKNGIAEISFTLGVQKRFPRTITQSLSFPT